MEANKQQQQGIQGQVSNMEKKRITRAPSFSDWNCKDGASCAWNDAGSGERKDAERSFFMLENMTEKPRVKIEPSLVEPPCHMHPVLSGVVPKGPRKPRRDPRKSLKQRAATPARGPYTEHSTSITSCLGMKRKEADADLQYITTPPPVTINDIIVKTMDSHFCEVCQTSCSSEWIFKQHLGGAVHKSKLEYQENKYACNLCKIVCTDEVNLNKHLIGKKHMAKEKKLHNGGRKPLHCKLCLVNCIDMDSFQAHLAGKPHAAKLKLCA